MPTLEPLGRNLTDKARGFIERQSGPVAAMLRNSIDGLRIVDSVSSSRTWECRVFGPSVALTALYLGF